MFNLVIAHLAASELKLWRVDVRSGTDPSIRGYCRNETEQGGGSIPNGSCACDTCLQTAPLCHDKFLSVWAAPDPVWQGSCPEFVHP